MSATLPRISPPKDFINMMREHHRVRTFVETGTYRGGTAMWASEHFERVVTIERAQGLYEQTVAQFGGTGNVEFLLGDTRTRLKEIVPTLASPAIFWLDAHWSGAETYGEQDECPLLEEIAVINASAQEHIILVDDARFFLAVPPKPHDVQQWPEIFTLLRCLSQSSQERYMIIYGDVITAAPVSMKAKIKAFYQQHSTPDGLSPVPEAHMLTRLLTRLHLPTK